MTLIIIPVVRVAHQALVRIVTTCPKEVDIIGAVDYDLGNTAATIVTILYFLAIITIVIGYATGLTNLIITVITQKFNVSSGIIYDIIQIRPLAVFIVMGVMTAVMFFSPKAMVFLCSALTFPLIFLLFALSLYLIPHWNFSIFEQSVSSQVFIKDCFLLLPFIVFAMNFSPVCSSVGNFYRKEYTKNVAEGIKRGDKVIKWNAIILVFFTMFFVISISLSSTPEILAFARAQNIDALTALSTYYQNPLLAIVPLVISFLAITTSYFGHFAGTREGLAGIFIRLGSGANVEKRHRLEAFFSGPVMTVILFVFVWACASFNPGILSVISFASAPLIAIYAYLMPVILLKKVPRLREYQSKWGIFVFVVGSLCIVSNIITSLM
jgi:serine transporter